MNKILIIVLVLGVILANIGPISCKGGRGGGGRGGGSRGGSRSGSRGGSRGGSKSSSSKSKSPAKGFKTLAKIGVAMYIARKMTPSVGFRYHGGTDQDKRPRYCADCISINGSNPMCENGTETANSSVQVCSTSLSQPYCSTEYGLTGDDKRYVRRSCNNKPCSSCSSSSDHFETNAAVTCYVIECRLCNWDGCNNVDVETAFPGAGSTSLPSSFIIMAASIATMGFLYK